MRSELTERSGRRRVIGALSGVLCVGFVLGASDVDARPTALLDHRREGLADRRVQPLTRKMSGTVEPYVLPAPGSAVDGT